MEGKSPLTIVFQRFISLSICKNKFTEKTTKIILANTHPNECNIATDFDENGSTILLM